MKKSTTRTVLVTLIAVASLGSYVFLNTAAGVTTPSSDVPFEIQSNELKEEINEHIKEVNLPDVMLLEQIIKIGKRFLPAS
ncbi:MAG: hypothetical protein IPJ74_22890 [Saprospiraceae bacterium]|nr:hypothetical protein [Saprospiraceae bacterium]